MLTVAFFGSGGEGSMTPLKAVAQRHRIIAVVKPEPSPSLFRGKIRAALLRYGMGVQAEITNWARKNNMPIISAFSGRDPVLASRLRALAPDVICVSAFPWLLGDEILCSVRREALNVHPSILPRHRGPNPLFWVYYHSDRRTGVTVHHMSKNADAGAILAQQSFDLPRGFPVDQLYQKNAELGARLLVQVLEEIETNSSSPVIQDELHATKAPQVALGTPMVEFSEWNVERVWHFLAGLCPRRREPFRDSSHREVRYRAVLGYTPGDCRFCAGTVQRTSFGWNLYCLGGSIQLADEKNAKRGYGS